jgi:hypothetical protein
MKQNGVFVIQRNRSTSIFVHFPAFMNRKTIYVTTFQTKHSSIIPPKAWEISVGTYEGNVETRFRFNGPYVRQIKVREERIVFEIFVNDFAIKGHIPVPLCFELWQKINDHDFVNVQTIFRDVVLKTAIKGADFVLDIVFNVPECKTKLPSSPSDFLIAKCVDIE